MPDESSPHIVIIPLPLIRPTTFSLTRSNIEYLLATIGPAVLSERHG